MLLRGHADAVPELAYDAFADLVLPDVILGKLPSHLDYLVGAWPGKAKHIKARHPLDHASSDNPGAGQAQ